MVCSEKEEVVLHTEEGEYNNNDNKIIAKMEKKKGYNDDANDR